MQQASATQDIPANSRLQRWRNHAICPAFRLVHYWFCRLLILAKCLVGCNGWRKPLPRCPINTFWFRLGSLLPDFRSHQHSATLGLVVPRTVAFYAAQRADGERHRGLPGATGFGHAWHLVASYCLMSLVSYLAASAGCRAAGYRLLHPQRVGIGRHYLRCWPWVGGCAALGPVYPICR